MPAIPVRHSVALFFGYTGSDITPKKAGAILLEAFLSAGSSSCGGIDNRKRQLISSTQSSIANSRHAFVQQDADCPSGMDTLVVNYLAVAAEEEEKKEAIIEEDQAEVDLANLQATLQKLLVVETKSNNITIQIHGLRTLDTKRTALHAEQGCTQHVYHFMVPVAWLPESDAILEWYRQNVITGKIRRQQKQQKHEIVQTPPSLIRFKDILRSFESDTSPTKVADGRYGTLTLKIKRPWHNYCDPVLRASPNHDVTKRILDRARFLDFCYSNNSNDSYNSNDNSNDADELFVVYEFRGDEFLSQQVRRIVGAAVAMVHGWLPDDFMETSLLSKSKGSKDSAVGLQLQETPLAPTGYLYQAAPRFHFAELFHKGVPLFGVKQIKDEYSDGDSESDSGKSWSTTRITEDPVEWIQQQLLSDMAKDNINNGDSVGDEWLVELRDTVAPRICAAQLKLQEGQEHDNNDGYFNTAAAAPDEYLHILELLQGIVANGEWPATSEARSKVMGTLEDPTQAGSFTVVDEANFDVLHPPQANKLFPELAAAVFQLQASISIGDNDNKSNSSTSSHCAVNCNAQFTPHVDSGRGAGQSLSTIVGLGEYRAGEIMIEGDAHNIRYKPLQFDGWKLRHWTRPFLGERFSLVWFTPEGVERKIEF